MRKSVLFFAMLTAAGCGGLKDGTYLLAATAVNENTCPFDDEDLASVGNHQVLVWNDSIMIGTRTYSRTGDVFISTASFTNDDLDPCFVKEDVTFSGLVLTNESFTIDVSGEAFVEGDCSNVNTEGLPCSYNVTLDGARVF